MSEEFDFIQQPEPLSLNEQLTEAVAGDDWASIDQLLKQGADVNYMAENGATPLIVAVLMNNPNVVRHLIEKGADVNKIGLDDSTALDLANLLFTLEKSGANDPEKLRLIQECRHILLDHDARTKQSIRGYAPKEIETEPVIEDVESLINVASSQNMNRLSNYCTRFGMSENASLKLLDRAVGEGWTKVIKFLAKRGVSLDEKDENGDTPLIKAARMGHLDVCECLLVEGANPDAVNKQNKSAFEVAIEADQGEVVAFFVDNEKTKLAFVNTEQLLNSAIEHGRFYVATELIEKEQFDKTLVLMQVLDSHHDVIYKKDKPVDMEKAHKARTRLAHWLINKGADLNVTDVEGNTPLMRAYQYGYHVLSMPMLERGADVNVQNVEGVTPLMLSVLSKTEDATFEMIAKGADPLKTTKTGWTALMLAGEAGQIDMFQYLIRNGAEQDLTKGTGGRAITLLAENLSSADEETASKILIFLREQEKKAKDAKRQKRFGFLRRLTLRGSKE